MIKETQTKVPAPPYEEIPQSKQQNGLMKLNRDVAFLMLLMVCLASIHNQQLPNGQTVLTAVQQTVDGQWEEDLGKITFVNSLMPESLSVFFAQPVQAALSHPCFGQMVHRWSDTSPYLSFLPESQNALCTADGEVMSISHASDDSLALRIRHDNGLESIYYHLEEVFCREGDIVKCGDTVAKIVSGENLILDVRKDGLSINPTAYFTDNMP